MISLLFLNKMNRSGHLTDYIYRMKSPKEQIIDELLVMDTQNGSAKAMEALVSRWQKCLGTISTD